MYGPLSRDGEVECLRGARDVGQVGELWVVPKLGTGMGSDPVLAAGLPLTACCCVPFAGTADGVCLVDRNMAAANSAAAMYAEAFL